LRNARRWAKIGITIQFLALVRCRHRAAAAVAALTVAALVALKVVLGA
jgi:hypothetical protein